MQPKLLHALLVEDSPDDADLILIELNNAAFNIVSTRVDTEAGMRVAMQSGNWDVIISDFNLPRFNAHGALAVLRDTGADIPVIIVSGCIGEERAIALMKEGASDFVMKDNLARLVPAIERELREAAGRREHRQTELVLFESEKLLRGIASSLGEGIFVLGDDGRLLFMNPEAERLLGWTERELLHQEVCHIIHAQTQDGAPLSEPCCGMQRVLTSGGVHRTEEDIFWRKDGSPIPVSIVASAIMENGKATASVIAFQDIRQRKQAEHDLLESRKQLRELSAHQQSVREEERTRIARELHDELGQMLTAVKLDAKWLATRLANKDSSIMNKITAMSGLLDQTLDTVRRVAADLRPVMLDDLGLAAAIEWLVEEFGKRTGINTHLELDIEQRSCNCRGDESQGAEVSTAIFRIVQECLTNITRHAHAEQVTVSLKCCDNKLVLRVSDNGTGMPATGDGKHDSFGIIGMRERAHNLGGTFDLASVPGEGTRVKVVIPAEPAQHAGAPQ